VRTVLATTLVLLSGWLAHAQEQEKKLLDRLLKPDMSLQNHAQDRQFVVGGAPLEKKARTKTFPVAKRQADKAFWNTREVPASEFHTQANRDAKLQANLDTRTKLARADVPYVAGSYGTVRSPVEAAKSVPATQFAGNRSFQGRGKSQKALSAQDRPMTIDQVRELLNKNK